MGTQIVAGGIEQKVLGNAQRAFIQIAFAVQVFAARFARSELKNDGGQASVLLPGKVRVTRALRDVEDDVTVGRDALFRVAFLPVQKVVAGNIGDAPVAAKNVLSASFT
jgi:hypothetical protein